jgi:protein subunit release factor A
MATMRECVHAHYAGAAHLVVNQQRKSQVGLGERSDKLRKYREDGVTNHRIGRKGLLLQVRLCRLELLS